MSFTTLSPTDLKAQFDRLKSLFGHYGAMGLKDNPQVFTQEYWRVLKHFRADEVSGAVDKWCGSTKDKWPTPGQLAALVFEARGERNQSAMTRDASFWQDDVCPCGCRWGWYAIPRPDGTTVTRWTQGCRARRDGYAPA